MLLTASLYMLFWLLVGHALCDTALQPDKLSAMKREPGWTGWMGLFGHGLIHGGAVAIATGSVPLGIAETLAHAFIDRLQCTNRIGMAVDQSLHVACKVAWIVILYSRIGYVRQI